MRHAGPIQDLIDELRRLPGIGARTAQRLAFHLLREKDDDVFRLADALRRAKTEVRECSTCADLTDTDPCRICADPGRDRSIICVVEEVADLWAIERTAAYRGRYQVLGGTLSALDGVGPEDLGIARLIARAREPAVTEVILATNATVDGQTTAHYIIDRLAGAGVVVSTLARGVPVGGELDYLDDGTLMAALKARRPS